MWSMPLSKTRPFDCKPDALLLCHQGHIIITIIPKFFSSLINDWELFLLADAVKPGCGLTTKQESISALGSFFHPSCVFVKRCGGCCKFGQECVAVETKPKIVDIFEFNSGKFLIPVFSLSYPIWLNALLNKWASISWSFAVNYCLSPCIPAVYLPQLALVIKTSSTLYK